MDTHHEEMCEKGSMGEMWEKKCHMHRGLRGLTAVIVIIFVFWCGFELGEIRALAGFDHSSGFRMMQGGFTGYNGY